MTLLEHFDHSVELHADRLAVRSASGSWTYAELDALSRITAGRLADLPGSDPVGLCARQDGPGLATLLAAMRSGRTGSPLDRGADPQDLRERLQTLGAEFLLSDDPELGARLAATGWPGEVLVLEEFQQAGARTGTDGANGARDLPHDATALIYFSSGSTGRPKGIELTQHSIAAGITNYAATLELQPGDRVAWLTPLFFGGSLTCSLGALVAGATLMPFDLDRGLRELATWLHDESITVYHSIPSLFRRLARSMPYHGDLPALRIVKLGGEPVLASDRDLLRRRVSADCVLVNGLGLTERVGNVCFFRSDRGDSPESGGLPVGHAVEGVELLLLDQAGEVLPPGATGEIGEIAVCSETLAKGYWRDPELTAARFAPLEARPGVRVFRTGDIGRFDAEGRLVHLGRSDRVVQIRGQGVALDDVEAALLRHPGVTEAAAFTERRGGDLQVVACCVAEDVEPRALRAALTRLLPAHAVPARVHQREALPRLASGKLDRVTLRTLMETDLAAPDHLLDPIEFHLRGVWERVLGLPGLDPEADFFELGGDSLAAAEIFAAVDRDFGVPLSMASLGEHGSIRSIAALIRERGVSSGTAPVLLQPRGEGAPIFGVPGLGQDVFALIELARKLTRQPFYGLQHRGLADGPLEAWGVDEMADHFVAQITTIQPRGPYRLLGSSFGGRVCFEIARRLRDAGEEIELLAFLDTFGTGYPRRRPGLDRRQRLAARIFQWECRGYVRDRYLKKPERLYNRLIRKVGRLAMRKLHRKLMVLRLRLAAPAHPTRMQRHHDTLLLNEHASQRARHEPADVRIDLFRCADRFPEGLFVPDRNLGWGGHAQRGIVIHDIPGHHGSYAYEPVVSEVGQRIQALLAQSGDEDPPDRGGD